MDKMFGTDGVRGIANRDLTPDLAYKLGVAGAMVLAGETKHKPTVLIGTDTRISCGMLEAALCSGILSAGADVLLTGVIPTPAVAYLTRFYHCDAGVMISASHNSYEYNGIKFFSGDGFKLPDQTEEEIEKLVREYSETGCQRPIGEKIGRVSRKESAVHEYIEHLKRRMSVDLSGLRIGLDCANGSASGIAAQLFEDLGADVRVISSSPDGLNINDDCGSTHMENLRKLVISEKLDIGIAFDGDADRMLAVDSEGTLIDGDIVLAIIGLDMKKRGELSKNTVVVTVMSNLGLDICANANGLLLEKTKVGDRYVLENMLNNGYNLGGEQSGHVILLDHSTTGDGILTSLALLRVLSGGKTTLSQASRVIRVLPQVLKPAHVPDDRKTEAMADKDLLDAIRKFEQELDGKGRILVRPSGTEPMIRVMLEGEDLDQINRIAVSLVDLIVSRYGTYPKNN